MFSGLNNTFTSSFQNSGLTLGAAQPRSNAPFTPSPLAFNLNPSGFQSQPSSQPIQLGSSLSQTNPASNFAFNSTKPAFNLGQSNSLTQNSLFPQSGQANTLGMSTMNQPQQSTGLFGSFPSVTAPVASAQIIPQPILSSSQDPMSTNLPDAVIILTKNLRKFIDDEIECSKQIKPISLSAVRDISTEIITLKPILRFTESISKSRRHELDNISSEFLALKKRISSTSLNPYEDTKSHLQSRRQSVFPEILKFHMDRISSIKSRLITLEKETELIVSYRMNEKIDKDQANLKKEFSSELYSVAYCVEKTLISCILRHSQLREKLEKLVNNLNVYLEVNYGTDLATLCAASSQSSAPSIAAKNKKLDDDDDVESVYRPTTSGFYQTRSISVAQKLLNMNNASTNSVF